ncbi:hypothetical protein SARC_14148, partial [Sphaeroforma arctica JP610]
QQNIRESKLINAPKSQWRLWLEYEEGLDNNKPAKSFTATGRGRVKSIYSHRNYFWKAMEKIISTGHSATDAIRKLEDVYGMALSVSNMCRALKNDKEPTKLQLTAQQQQLMG